MYRLKVTDFKEKFTNKKKISQQSQMCLTNLFFFTVLQHLHYWMCFVFLQSFWGFGKKLSFMTKMHECFSIVEYYTKTDNRYNNENKMKISFLLQNLYNLFNSLLLILYKYFITIFLGDRNFPNGCKLTGNGMVEESSEFNLNLKVSKNMVSTTH